MSGPSLLLQLSNVILGMKGGGQGAETIGRAGGLGGWRAAMQVIMDGLTLLAVAG